jgi:phosphatidylinositol alpha-1,6-mannosyltransferase
MRILIVTIDYPPPYGGIATFTQQLETFIGNVHDVKVLNFDSRNTNNYELLSWRDFFPTAATKNSFFSLRNIFNPKKLLDHEGGFRDFVFTNMVYRITGQIIESWKPDSIHLTHARVFSAVFERAVPYVVTCHSEEVLDTFGVKYVLNHAQKIHCVSEFTKDKVLAVCPEVKGSTTVIHNAIDTSLYSHVDHEDFRFITICRLDRAKNVPMIVRAIAKLPTETRTKVQYDIVGSGDTLQEIQSLIQEYNLGNSIHLHGSVSDQKKRELLSKASVFIMCPTPFQQRSEGFGIVYLEAQAAHLPIIASTIGGVPEAVSTCGILVEDERDPQQIADAMQKLLSDPSLYRRLQENAIRRASEIDVHMWAMKINQLYSEL